MITWQILCHDRDRHNTGSMLFRHWKPGFYWAKAQAFIRPSKLWRESILALHNCSCFLSDLQKYQNTIFSYPLIIGTHPSPSTFLSSFFSSFPPPLLPSLPHKALSSTRYFFFRIWYFNGIVKLLCNLYNGIGILLFFFFFRQ